MLKYLAKRIGRSILTLFVIVTLVFCLLRLMPVEGYFANYEKMTEAHLYVTSAAMRDTATYKRLRAQAEREHLTFQPVRTLADVEGANDGNA